MSTKTCSNCNRSPAECAIESEEFYDKISSGWRMPLQPGAGGTSP